MGFLERTSGWAIIGIIFCTLFTSTGQLMWKIGMDKFQLNILAILTNWPLMLGFLSYGIGLIIMLVSLKHGELSVLYPFVALSFIWVAFMSVGFLNEVITPLNWLGIATIIAGVSFIGLGAEK